MKTTFLLRGASSLCIAKKVEPVVTISSKQIMLSAGGISTSSKIALTLCFDLALATLEKYLIPANSEINFAVFSAKLFSKCLRGGGVIIFQESENVEFSGMLKKRLMKSEIFFAKKIGIFCSVFICDRGIPYIEAFQSDKKNTPRELILHLLGAKSHLASAL